MVKGFESVGRPRKPRARKRIDGTQQPDGQVEAQPEERIEFEFPGRGNQDQTVDALRTLNGVVCGDCTPKGMSDQHEFSLDLEGF